MYRPAHPATVVDMPQRTGSTKLQDALRQQCLSLERYKEKLRQEIRTLEKDLKTATDFGFNHNENNNILTQCKLFGYFLTNCKTTDLGDGNKQYTACCEDSRHPFRISVSCKGDDVTQVKVALSSTSPLNEIKIVLDNLSEDNCPGLVLSTIQQFIHLHNFRIRIIQEKLQSLNGERNCFQVYHPDFSQERARPHYLITAQHGTIEIIWTIAWDKVDHSLVHEFTIQKSPASPNLKRLTKELLAHTFSARNANILWDWWTEFCNIISCV